MKQIACIFSYLTQRRNNQDSKYVRPVIPPMSLQIWMSHQTFPKLCITTFPNTQQFGFQFHQNVVGTKTPQHACNETSDTVSSDSGQHDIKLKTFWNLNRGTQSLFKHCVPTGELSSQQGTRCTLR